MQGYDRDTGNTMARTFICLQRLLLCTLILSATATAQLNPFKRDKDKDKPSIVQTVPWMFILLSQEELFPDTPLKETGTSANTGAAADRTPAMAYDETRVGDRAVLSGKRLFFNAPLRSTEKTEKTPQLTRSTLDFSSMGIEGLDAVLKMQHLRYREDHSVASFRLYSFRVKENEALFNRDIPDKDQLSLAYAVNAGIKAIEQAAAPTPLSGIILDLRGNEGGSGRQAECLLGLLREKGSSVNPALASFRCTNLTLRFCKNRQKDFEDDRLGFEFQNHLRWEQSIKTRMREGFLYSDALPLTDPALLSHFEEDELPNLPFVVLVDALTFSAGELFASGAQYFDNAEVIGHAQSTAGGGANVMTVQDIDKPVQSKLLIGNLPNGGVATSIRRLVRLPDYRSFERVGVQPDFVRPPTRYDMLYDNYDLILFATRRVLVLSRQR